MEIIAFSNKKGGTGKTTSAINFCAALGRKGYKVLAIDLDPQANFTADSGGEAIGTVAGTFDFILGAPLEDVVQHNEYYDFMGADKRIENQRNKFEEKGSDFLLKKALAKVEGYDFVVLDTAPSMSGIVFLALVACNRVIGVCDADQRSVTGLGDLYSAIQSAADYNPGLKIDGILITRDVPRTQANKFAVDVFHQAAAQINSIVFSTHIKERTVFHQCTALHTNVFNVDARSDGAKDYEAFTDEVLELFKNN